MFDFIIKDSKEVLSDIIPTMYFIDNQEVVVTKLCNLCGPILKQFDLTDKNDMKSIYNIIKRCYIFCSLDCQLTDNKYIEDLKKLNKDDLRSVTTIDTKIEIGTKGLYTYVNIGSTRDEKFQESMKKEAEKLEHAERERNIKNI